MRKPDGPRRRSYVEIAAVVFLKGPKKNSRNAKRPTLQQRRAVGVGVMLFRQALRRWQVFARLRLQAIDTAHIRVGAEEPQAIVKDRRKRQIPRRQIDVAYRAALV